MTSWIVFMSLWALTLAAGVPQIAPGTVPQTTSGLTTTTGNQYNVQTRNPDGTLATHFGHLTGGNQVDAAQTTAYTAATTQPQPPVQVLTGEQAQAALAQALYPYYTSGYRQPTPYYPLPAPYPGTQTGYGVPSNYFVAPPLTTHTGTYNLGTSGYRVPPTTQYVTGSQGYQTGAYQRPVVQTAAQTYVPGQAATYDSYRYAIPALPAQTRPTYYPSYPSYQSYPSTYTGYGAYNRASTYGRKSGYQY